MKNIRLCFVSLHEATLPLLKNIDAGLVGGAEVQQISLSKKLKERGLDVRFVTLGPSNEPIEVIDDIAIYPTFRLQDGIKGFRLFYPRLYKLWKTLKEVDADIYYQRSRSMFTGMVALFCRAHRKRFVFSVSHDFGVDRHYIKTASLDNAILYNYGLKRADIVVVQSETQKRLLKRYFNREGIVVKSGCTVRKADRKRRGNRILWVSTLRKWKRPELFLKLAEKVQEGNFTMVGGPDEDLDYYNLIKTKASTIKNLNFVGFVPYNLVDKHFDTAQIFVNTSTKEGFPNTFLQAWVREIPTVSLNVDPDEIICKRNLGFHSKTFERMVKDVRTLLRNDETKTLMGKNCRRCVEDNHDIEKISDQYAELFYEL